MEPAARRRPLVPIALGVLLLLGVGATLLLVMSDTSGDAPSGPEDDAAAAAAAASARASTRVRTPDLSVPRSAGAGGPPPASTVTSPGVEDHDDVAQRAVEAEARRRVFDEDAGGAFLGSRGGVTRVGVGGRAGGGFATPLPEIAGRIVDDETGEPIAGADVASVVARRDGSRARHHLGITGADGTFSAPATRPHRRAFHLIVRAPGYLPMRHACEHAPEEWRLRPAPASERGTVRGRAQDSIGTPLPGLLLVALNSDDGDSVRQYAWCDATGSFELGGLHPGRWTLWLEAKRPSTANVFAGGVVTVRLIADSPTSPSPERPGEDRRTVEVTGLDDGTWLLATGGRDIFWRSVVRDGAARFELPFGLWVLTVDRPDGADMPIVVKRGAGLWRIAFEPDRE